MLFATVCGEWRRQNCDAKGTSRPGRALWLGEMRMRSAHSTSTLNCEHLAAQTLVSGGKLSLFQVNLCRHVIYDTLRFYFYNLCIRRRARGGMYKVDIRTPRLAGQEDVAWRTSFSLFSDLKTRRLRRRLQIQIHTKSSEDLLRRCFAAFLSDERTLADLS